MRCLRLETLKSLLFIFENLKDSEKLGDREEIHDALSHLHELERAAGLSCGYVVPHNLVEAGIVDAGHILQIEEKVAHALVEQLVNLIPEHINLTESHFTLEIENRYVADLTNFNLHKHLSSNLG
mgnify:CR=1 FL=1